MGNGTFGVARRCAEVGGLGGLVVEGPLTAVVVVCGVAGSLGGLWALRKGRLAGPDLARTLTCLAVWDTLLLLSVLAYYAAHRTALLFGLTRHKEVSMFFASMTVGMHPIISICYTASSLLVLCLTTQRYVAVSDPLILGVRVSCALSDMGCRCGLPLRWRKLFRPPFLISAFCILLHLPSFKELQKSRCWNGVLRRWDYSVGPTELRRNPDYVLWWRLLCVKGVLTNLFPSILIAVLSLFLIAKLRKASKDRGDLGVRRRSDVVEREVRAERAVSWLLMVITLKFLASHLIPSILDTWDFLSYTSPTPGSIEYAYLFMGLVKASNFLVVLNSATNFIIYISGRQMQGSQLFSCYQGIWRRRSSTFGSARGIFRKEEAVRLQVSCSSMWEEDAPPTPMELRRRSKYVSLSRQLLTAMLGRRSTQLSRPISRLESRLRNSNYHLNAGPGAERSLSLDSVPPRGEEWAEGFDEASHAAAVSQFFIRLVDVLQNSTLTGKAEAEDMVTKLAATHRMAGVTFTPQMWRTMKKVLMDAARSSDCVFHDKDETARIWGQLANWLISHMRRERHMSLSRSNQYTQSLLSQQALSSASLHPPPSPFAPAASATLLSPTPPSL